MNLSEYNKVKDYTYLEYCDYLQKKYGLPSGPYRTKDWKRNNKIGRTKEGLIIHHKFEDHAIRLSTEAYAINNPYEWQLPENLVCCDYLEHLLLHILICEYPSEDANENALVGVGGVLNFLVPELNDFYSGWRPSAKHWKSICLNRVKDDIDVYFALLKRFKNEFKGCEPYLRTSFNEQYGLWSREKNKELFEKIKEL